jgi:hypothetical protein
MGDTRMKFLILLFMALCTLYVTIRILQSATQFLSSL